MSYFNYSCRSYNKSRCNRLCFIDVKCPDGDGPETPPPSPPPSPPPEPEPEPPEECNDNYNFETNYQNRCGVIKFESINYNLGDDGYENQTDLFTFVSTFQTTTINVEIKASTDVNSVNIGPSDTITILGFKVTWTNIQQVNGNYKYSFEVTPMSNDHGLSYIAFDIGNDTCVPGTNGTFVKANCVELTDEVVDEESKIFSKYLPCDIPTTPKCCRQSSDYGPELVRDWSNHSVHHMPSDRELSDYLNEVVTNSGKHLVTVPSGTHLVTGSFNAISDLTIVSRCRLPHAGFGYFHKMGGGDESHMSQYPSDIIGQGKFYIRIYPYAISVYGNDEDPNFDQLCSGMSLVFVKPGHCPVKMVICGGKGNTIYLYQSHSLLCDHCDRKGCSQDDEPCHCLPIGTGFYILPTTSLMFNRDTKSTITSNTYLEFRGLEFYNTNKTVKLASNNPVVISESLFTSDDDYLSNLGRFELTSARFHYGNTIHSTVVMSQGNINGTYLSVVDRGSQLKINGGSGNLELSNFLNNFKLCMGIDHQHFTTYNPLWVAQGGSLSVENCMFYHNNIAVRVTDNSSITINQCDYRINHVANWIKNNSSITFNGPNYLLFVLIGFIISNGSNGSINGQINGTFINDQTFVLMDTNNVATIPTSATTASDSNGNSVNYQP